MNAFDPTPTEIAELLKLSRVCAHAEADSRAVEMSKLYSYITHKNDEQPGFYKAPYNDIVEIAAKERDYALLDFSLRQGGRAPDSTLNDLQGDDRYEPSSYAILGMILSKSKEPFFLGPVTWQFKWNELLMDAAINDKTEFVALYFKYKPVKLDLVPEEKYYVYLLPLVAQSASALTVHILMTNGAYYNGSSAMARAARAGKFETVEHLVRVGVDCNDESDGYRKKVTTAEQVGSALHEAVLHGHDEIVDLLLSNGGDLSKNYFDKRTTLDLAKASGNKKVIKMVQKSGTKK